MKRLCGTHGVDNRRGERIVNRLGEIVQRKMPDESAKALAAFVEKHPVYQGSEWADVLMELDLTEAHIDMIEKVTCDFENTYGIPDGRQFLPHIILTLFYGVTDPQYPKVRDVRDHLERIA